MSMSVAAKARAWLLDYVFAVRWQARSLVGGSRSEQPSGSGRTVVLLPGIWESARFLRPLARDLTAHGHRVHVLPGLGWNGAPVVSSAELVAAELARLDLRDVVLVAHSKGGLIGKYVMALLDEDRRVASMIAISTPFSGSRFAPYLVLASLRAFSPADPTTLLLAEHHEVDARITSIWAAFDPHIPGGSALRGARNVELPLGGHFRILGSRLLRDEVLRALGRSDGGAPQQVAAG